MPGFKPFLRELIKSDFGVTALEYGLIVALIGVAAIGAMSGVGEKLDRNLDIVIAAVGDQPAPVDNPSPPGDGDGPTVSDPVGGPARTAVPDIPAPAPGDDIGRNSTTTIEGEQADRSSGGENLGTGAGGSDPSYTAAVSTADGSGAGGGSTGYSSAGGAGRSAGGGAGNAAAGSNGISDPGVGQGGEPGNAEPGGKSSLFGRDSTSAASHDATASGPGNTLPKQVGASGSGGKARFIDRAPGGSGESPLKSAIILLLWLCLGIGVVILGWKITLRAATKKDAKEQLENWEPASFGEKSVAQLG